MHGIHDMEQNKNVRFFRMITRPAKEPPTRIATLDTMRGMSIIMVLYIHIAGSWCTSDWVAFMRAQWYMTEFFGAAMFITISMVGSMVAMRAQNTSGIKAMYTRRRLLRISFLIIYGEGINIVFSGHLGIYALTNWNIILIIGIFSLLLPLMLRLHAVIRLVIIVLIIASYYPLVNWLMPSFISNGVNIDTLQVSQLQDPRAFIYWLLLFQDMMSPFYSWLVIPLAVSIIFDKFAAIKDFTRMSDVTRELKKIGLVGFTLIVTGILAGSMLAPDYIAPYNIQLQTPGSFFTWPFSGGMFVFFIRSTPQYLSFHLGIVCLFFAFIGRRQLVHAKSMLFESRVDNMGRLSLTVFALSSAIPAIPNKLPVGWFYIVVIPMICIITWFLWMWNKKWQRIGTIDWIMDAYVNGISYVFDLNDARRAQQKNAAS
jgi:hypothetical protein